MDTIETLMHKICGCESTIDLDKIVGDYLLSIEEADNARGETYHETAQRLGGNKVLELANEKLFTLDTGWFD